MKVSSFKLKVKSFLKNLSTVYGLLSGAKLYKLSLRGAERRSNLKRNKIATPFGLAMTCKHNECVCINKSGFTLIEIIMIMIVVAIAIPTLLIVLGQGAKQGVNAELEISATNVGQALMEEIKTKCWDETAVSGGACTGTVTPSAIQTDAGEGGAGGRTSCTGNPNLYDDVDDYNGYTETCTWGGPSYTTAVQVCYVQPGDLNNTSPCVTNPALAADKNYKRIQVTVTNTTLGSVNLVTVVTNYY